MADREKVINGLECCVLFKGFECTNRNCPYWKDCSATSTSNELLHDVLAMFKAQEPVLDDTGVYHCMDCRHPVGYKNSAGVLFPHCFYCPRCGKAVKWDD